MRQTEPAGSTQDAHAESRGGALSSPPPLAGRDAVQVGSLDGGFPAVSGLAVRTSGLTKYYGDRPVVDGVDLAVPGGVVSGFVGPNGAGKTTTLRMLLGLVRPSAGSGEVLGEPIDHPERYLPRVGALIEGPAFYPTLSGRRNLEVLARLGGHDGRSIDRLLGQVGLGERGDDPFRAYSLGMKQRLGIAAALLPEPEVLMLDEPANGLDPAGIREIRGLLRGLADGGITVFVSSHLLSEVETICDHVVVIDRGRLVFQGGMEALLAAQRSEIVAAPERPENVAALSALVARAGYVSSTVDGEVHVAAPSEWAPELNRLAMAEGITLAALGVRRGTLEEAFFSMTKDVPGAAR